MEMKVNGKINTPKAIILIFIILLCFGATYYSHFILGSEVVFTHLFYIPIILAGLWWEGAAVWVAVALGGWLIVSHRISGLPTSYAADLMRSGMFILISLVFGLIWKRCIKTERRLRETRDFMSNLISHSGTPILVWDESGRITISNGAFETLTGYRTEELYDKNVKDFFSEESFAVIENSLSSEYSGSSEFSIRCKDGREAICLWNTANIYSPDGKKITAGLIQGQDITKRKWAEEIMKKHAEDLEVLNTRLAGSEKDLRELNAAKDKFFSIISHDLRSPFMPLLQFSKMLWKDFDSMKPSQIREYAQGINRNARRLYALIENLLEWSRIQTGRMSFQPSLINVGEIVTENIELLGETAAKKNISLVNKIGGNITAYADRYHVNCVIQNLICNGIKFTNPGGEVVVSAAESDGKLNISVCDNGVGMDDEIKSAIFCIDKYHSTLGTAREKGSGLGLILCKELVEKNGGAITVESGPGSGSTFSFTLPKES